jgi:cytochrome P450
MECVEQRLTNDPRIFRVGTPFDRIWHDNPFLTGSLQSQQTLQETKKRKEFFASFFSKGAIIRVEPLLHRQKLIQFLDTLRDTVENNGGRAVIDFYLGFRCLTADTIMDYCFQNDLNALASPGFQNPTVNAFIEGFDLALISAYFPNFFRALNKIIFALPEGIRAKYFAPVYGFQTMQNLSRERVEYLMANPEKTNSSVPTLFDAMLNPDTKKGQVTPSMHDMTAEGCLMIAAGTDTTANSLGIVLWNVTQNPDVEAKLLAELKQIIPDQNAVLDSATLEGDGFKYMRAVVKESLRLSFGVPGRIIRRTPKEGAYFSGKFVPGGVSVYSDTN